MLSAMISASEHFFLRSFLKFYLGFPVEFWILNYFEFWIISFRIDITT